VYAASLAPTVTYWDSGEFLSAIRTLGIPHPPGTPLYILIANVWAKVFSPMFGFAYSVNLLSAVSTAIACGIIAHLMLRWTADKWAAAAGGILAGLMSSVWLNANETEVYSPSLLLSLILLLIAEHARSSRDARWYVLLAYVCGLAWSLQLSALVAAPAAFYLAFIARPDVTLEKPRRIAALIIPMLIVAALGASAVLFMLVRAKHDPAINQGNPSTWQAFVDVLTRKQYLPVSMLPRQAPWYIQIGNFFEYADWQVALGLHSEAPPSLLRTPFTIVYGILGAIGFGWHRRIHRPSWEVLTVLFITATLGVIVYLNLKAGPSYGEGFLPPGAKHEARERDYFFALGFLCWGVWAGAGAVRGFSRLNSRWKYAGVLVAILPAFLNAPATNRARKPDATAAIDSARRILLPAPQRAVVFAYGDNDTYPVWYAQQVENARRDVTLVTIPLLGATWYRAELARRDSLLDDSYVAKWRGPAPTMEAICAAAKKSGRAVIARPVRDRPAIPSGCLP
jgi:hypothetical protein